MEAAPPQMDLASALSRLQVDRAAIPWHQRRDLVQGLAETMASAPPSESCVALLELLTLDSKPEVRHAVANLLPLLADGLFAKIAAVLGDDSNAFVRKAVQRSLDRRRRGRQEASRKRRNVAEVQGDYAAMERLHGRPAAERARQMCERFAEVLVGTAVHNMRGVLTPMKISTSAAVKQIDAGLVDARSLKETLARVSDQVRFMERLLDEMRAYSQPVAAERRRERLADVVGEARHVAAEYLCGSGRDPSPVSVAVSVPENIMVDMTRHQIVVALANILKNAHEAFATEQGGFRPGQIGLEAVLTPEDVRLTLRDNGAGLAEEDLRDLREFVPGRTSKKTYGTGFGLPIARRYVLAHGGSLEIDSQMGSGTTVVITLPLEQEEAEKP